MNQRTIYWRLLRFISAALMIGIATAANAAVVIDEVPFEFPDFGGFYNLTVDGVEVSAFGVTNEFARLEDIVGIAEPTGWAWRALDSTDWDAGETFSTDTPGGPLDLFTTGAGGIGTYETILGTDEDNVFIFWLEHHSGVPISSPGSTEEFGWEGAPPFSSAFAWTSAGCMSGGTGSALGACGVVPIPAAVWLFGSALGLLGWRHRKAA